MVHDIKDVKDEIASGSNNVCNVHVCEFGYASLLVCTAKKFVEIGDGQLL